VKLRSECLETFERSGIVKLVGTESFFNKIRDAYQFVRMGRRDPTPLRLGIPVTGLPFRRAPSSIEHEEFTSFDQLTRDDASSYSTP
jgi:hypothetical protein